MKPSNLLRLLTPNVFIIFFLLLFLLFVINSKSTGYQADPLGYVGNKNKMAEASDVSVSRNEILAHFQVGIVFLFSCFV